MRLTRADDSLLAEWWFTVDRQLMTVFFALIGLGVMLSLAASPAVAVRKGLPAFHFVERQMLFASVGAVVMVAVSMLDPRQIRRLALLLTAGALLALVAVLFVGPEINGSRRWIKIAGLSVQPSEFVKPGLIVVSAWLLAQTRGRPNAPQLLGSLGLYLLTAALLISQPDVGQTLLISAVWGTLFFLSGQPLLRALLFGTALLGAGAAAALTLEHARRRVVRYFVPSSGDTYQTDRAIQSFSEGGLLGRGPGEGSVKSVLPDAHTDFIFAVIGEEFGAIACLALIGLFAFIFMRAASRARSEPDLANRLALIGLALVVTLQAAINMGVNVGLLPAKGMTLPFISAGGSSSIALSITAGMLLALTRRRTDVAHVKLPQLRPRLGAAR